MKLRTIVSNKFGIICQYDVNILNLPVHEIMPSIMD
jgi:hypothetical protein